MSKYIKELESENRLLRELISNQKQSGTQKIVARWVRTIDRIYRLVKWSVIIAFIISFVISLIIVITGIGRGQSF